jgi:hypothetical protein
MLQVFSSSLLGTSHNEKKIVALQSLLLYMPLVYWSSNHKNTLILRRHMLTIHNLKDC